MTVEHVVNIPMPLKRPLMDTRAAGNYTGLGERYIRRLRAERRIACVRIGGRVLFDPDDLDRLIDMHRESPINELPSGAPQHEFGNARRLGHGLRRRSVG